jgi:flagellar biosynthesis chaperone FliJ
MVNYQNIIHTYGDKINIHEYYEVEYWSKALEVNVEQLRKAVSKAGNSVDAVIQYLELQQISRN